MKKKLVAFAVTAAMVITSAVPALAWGPAGQDEWPSTNEVLIDANHLEGGISETGTTIKNGDTYSITVDFNRTSGSFQYVLNMVDGNGDPVQQILEIDGNNKHVYMTQDAADTAKYCKVDGITTFTWKFDTSKADKSKQFVDLIVDVQGTLGNEAVYSMNLGGAQSVKNVVFENWKGGNVTGSTIVYQNQIPDEIQSVEVVKANYDATQSGVNTDVVDAGYSVAYDKYGEVQPVSQLVEGECYTVNSITLNDGTVIKGYTDIQKYAEFTWKAVKRDGTAVDPTTTFATNSGLSLNLQTLVAGGKDLSGCYVTLEVKPIKAHGIFVGTTWGADAESLAIQQRIAGDDRYDTAMKVADQMENAGSFNTIFVATGTNYADALSVTALADKMSAPILLVNADHEDEVVQYIKDNVASYDAKVYIVGGTSAVSANFEKALKKVAVDVDRLAGADRYDTNIAVLKAYDNPEGVDGGMGVDGDATTILVASGTGYADALSAASTGKPVLLVGSELTKAQREFLYELGAGTSNAGNRTYVVIGGRTAVSNDVKDEIAAAPYTTNDVTRIGGVDRYETNMMVMDEYVNNATAKYVFVASGMDYPDALTGGVLAAQNDAPLVLVNANVTDPASDIVDNISDNNGYAGLVVIGGENAVSNATVQKIA